MDFTLDFAHLETGQYKNSPNAWKLTSKTAPWPETHRGKKAWGKKKKKNYVALLDDNRWVKRILHWNPGGGRPGRPFFQWQTPLENFCRWHHLDTWLHIARNTDLWFQY